MRIVALMCVTTTDWRELRQVIVAKLGATVATEAVMQTSSLLLLYKQIYNAKYLCCPRFIIWGVIFRIKLKGKSRGHLCLQYFEFDRIDRT